MGDRAVGREAAGNVARPVGELAQQVLANLDPDARAVGDDDVAAVSLERLVEARRPSRSRSTRRTSTGSIQMAIRMRLLSFAPQRPGARLPRFIPDSPAANRLLTAAILRLTG